MSTVIHAVFSDAPAAHRALDHAHFEGVDGSPFAGDVHEGHVREEEVPMSGSDAVRGAVMGGLGVGLFAALFGAVVFWPMEGYDFGITAAVMLFLGASLFGIVAGGLAGASEAKTSVRAAARQLRAGQAILTCEVANADVAAVCEHLEAEGGLRVQVA